ncbi:alkene reductase [Parvularcula sp. LCG005]|uniref:alkene reductase n=1 Tax=Parvularcula sp. LCG005 TaxID=3078805 RepID=UPI002942511C|nr:alkene reductase [Parvularcula sp. LCG005]WOI54712.1 alkene reductase [Parvularcula sp. LCG005]
MSLSPKNSDLKPLFEPIAFGDIKAKNRVLMAPLTRNRSHADGTPAKMAIEYYRQRAGAGLIITEATQISAQGKGYKDTPGIYTPKHIAAWKEITDAVHAEGGKIVCQLWHVGRISHTSLQEGGKAPVSASDIAAETMTFTENGFEPTSKPRALTPTDIRGVVRDYVHAAKCAMEAGFDGVEVHGANGYLIDQFLQESSNPRTDSYGGNPEKRVRFLMEVVTAVVDAIGAGRTGLRLSPTGKFNDVSSTDTEKVFTTAIDRLNPLGLAYLHVVERFPGMPINPSEEALLTRLQAHWNGPFISNGGYGADDGASTIGKGRADAIAYGRPYIANPDLAERFAAGASLNTPDQDTFYGGGAHGYTDYPFMNEKKNVA